MSSDQNRPRPRSSKKRRAVQPGAAARPAGGPRGSAGQRGSGGQRPKRGTPAANRSGGLSTPMLAAIAVVVFGVGVALAGGVVKFGSDPAPSGAAASRVVRGTNCPTSQPPAAPAGENRVIKIETAKGTIEMTLSANLSPIAVGNFEALAGCGYYDGIVFHRLVPGFVIQGGDPTGTGTGGPGYTIKDEPVTTPYGRGIVAMARSSGKDTVGSQFFIVLSDEARAALAQANTYQIIGTVTSGMETVDAIAAMPNAGGQSNAALDPVAMTKVTVGPPVAASPSAASPSAASPSAASPSAVTPSAVTPSAGSSAGSSAAPATSPAPS